ncbi:MAG: hypothetical protein K9L17_10050 [Clostridiales bacterium]|nr:hypothetical protein [Clostridiales bacterium]MCF8023022.1 hypothetical protein [Clostridiales bacterium]
MEKELMLALIGGYSLFIVIALIVIIYFWKTSKSYRDVYYWIVAHLLFFSAAVVFGFKAIDKYMGSAGAPFLNNLVYAGILWFVSIVCLLVGAVRIKSKMSKEMNSNDGS